MKQSLIKVTALMASLMPTAAVMAHSEVTGQSVLQSAAHNLVHTLQAHPWLPFASGVAILAALFIVRKLRRES